jgi:hypothetical protein
MAGNIATMFFPRAIYDKVGPFREHLKVSGDFEFFVRVCARHSVGRITMPVVEIRNHDGQLSRARHSELFNMRENEAIFDELSGRFPPELDRHHRRYRLRRQYVKYFHYAIRAVLGGNVLVGAAGLRFLAEVTNPVVVGWWWLVSANARFFRPATLYLSPSGHRYLGITPAMSGVDAN